MTSQPPTTGQHDVDRALAALHDLDDHDVATHHDRLAAAQEALARALEDSGRPVAFIPEALRPRTDHHG